jgi:hypothetical protein
MTLIPPHYLARLLANGQIRRQLLTTHPGARPDFLPVVRLFMPDGAASWLLTEIDPDNEDRAFGLCDLGLGFPELGYVSLSELASVRGILGLPVECDLDFEARNTLSEYSKQPHIDS